MRARRIDANHGEIKRAFERLGCAVFDAYSVGKGFPDLVVQVGIPPAVITLLVEVKTRTGKLTDAQESFRLHSVIARTADDVAAIVADMRLSNRRMAALVGSRTGIA
jgi:hypothetical protein